MLKKIGCKFYWLYLFGHYSWALGMSSKATLRLKSFLVLFLILYLILQDPQSVREARQIEQKFIKKWIDQYHKQEPSGGHDDTVDPIIVG